MTGGNGVVGVDTCPAAIENNHQQLVIWRSNNFIGHTEWSRKMCIPRHWQVCTAYTTVFSLRTTWKFTICSPILITCWYDGTLYTSMTYSYATYLINIYWMQCNIYHLSLWRKLANRPESRESEFLCKRPHFRRCSVEHVKKNKNKRWKDKHNQ